MIKRVSLFKFIGFSVILLISTTLINAQESSSRHEDLYLISGSHMGWGLDTTEFATGTYYPLYLWKLDQGPDTLQIVDTLSDKEVYGHWRSYSNCADFKWIPQAKVFTFKESGHHNLAGFDYAKSLHYGDSLMLYIWDSIPYYYPISASESYIYKDTFLFKQIGKDNITLWDHQFNEYKMSDFDSLYFFEQGYPNTEIGSTTGRIFSVIQNMLNRHWESSQSSNVLDLCDAEIIENFDFSYIHSSVGFQGIINTYRYYVFKSNQYKLEAFKKGQSKTSTTIYYIVDKQRKTLDTLRLPELNTNFHMQVMGDFLFGQIGYYVDEHKDSPGKELRNTETNQYGTSFDWRTGGRTFYSGEMYVYHIPSKSMYEIDTKQGDTEIITIDTERNQLFLRIHDKIYIVPIVDNAPIWEEKYLIYEDWMIAPHIHRVFYSKGDKLIRKYING